MVTRYIKSYSTQVDEYADIQVGKLNRPYVAYLEDEDRIDWDSYVEPPHDYSKDYCTIIVNQPGYLKLLKRNSPQTVTLEYSLDEGTTWKSFSSSQKVTITTDSAEIWLRGNNSKGFGQLDGTTIRHHYLYYSSSPDPEPYEFPNLPIPFSVKGNLLSLIQKEGFDEIEDLRSFGGYLFYFLFGQSKIISAENLVFPVKYPSACCFRSLFTSCGDLTTAPKTIGGLYGTDSANMAYGEMFYNCTNMTKGPEVMEIQSWSTSAFYQMFRNCSKMTKSPKMSFGVNYQVPEGYTPCNYMFKGCSQLKEIYCLAETAPSGNSTILKNWTDGVASEGIFYVKPGTLADWEAWPRGVNGVPVGWTIVEYQDN